MRLSPSTSWTLVFCIDTHVYTISKVIKQANNKWSLMRKYKYGYQMHSTYAELKAY